MSGYPHGFGPGDGSHQLQRLSQQPEEVRALHGPTATEHSCEVCGCTDSRACSGGCSWSEFYRIRGRWVCSCCTAPAAAAEVGS